ncbi:MAG: fibronectin type III domain-containing protein [Myxococcota bacterium]
MKTDRSMLHKIRIDHCLASCCVAVALGMTLMGCAGSAATEPAVGELDAGAPADIATPGDTESAVDTAAPADIAMPGDTAAPGDIAMPGDTAAPGDTESAVDTAAPGDTESAVDTGPPLDSADAAPPTWPADATLAFLGIDENSLVVSWPAATDNVAVVAYHVTREEQGLDSLITTLDAETLALQLSQLTSGETLHLTVQAVDAAGNVSTDGPTGSVTVSDDSAPTWPAESALSVSEVGESFVTLTWTPAEDNVATTGYRLYQNNVEVAALAADELSYTADDLDAWNVYVFRVEAEDALGNLSTSGPSLSVQTGDDTPPYWPENATAQASALTDTGVSLGWDPAEDDVGVAGYRIWKDGVEMAPLPGATTWVTVEALSPWTDYTFEIGAADAAGNQTETLLTLTVFTPDSQAPTWPEATALLGSDGTDTSLTLSWAAAHDEVGVTGYRLFQDNVLLESLGAAETSTTVNGLNATDTFVFRVEAEDAAGNVSHNGPTLVANLSDQSPPTWSADATCIDTNATPTSVFLSWTAATDNTGVTGYAVLSDDTVLASTNGDTASVLVTGLTPLTEYTVSIIANDGAGNTSEGGPTLTFTTPDYAPPSWPWDATLSADSLTPTEVVLMWTAFPASDAAVSLAVLQDDTEVLALDLSDVSVTIPDLTPGTAYDFRVEALGPTGLMSSDGPQLTLSTPDYTVPGWPEDAALTASDVTETSLTLTWTALPEDGVVSTYTISQGGEAIGTVTVPEHSLEVTGLSPAMTYQFSVEATGPTGLVSTGGPTLNVATVDVTAPAWPSDAVITPLALGSTNVELTWPTATDNVEVTGYDLMLGDTVAASVDGQTTSISLSELTPETDYQAHVMAYDAAGNVSTGNPTVAFTTNAASVGLSTAEVYDGLHPHCSMSACHGEAGTPFFASLADFEALVVDNIHFVIPGDPDGSVLVKVLEGNGTAPWTQMPLVGPTFQEMANAGETSITVTQIRNWIAHMEGN